MRYALDMKATRRGSLAPAIGALALIAALGGIAAVIWTSSQGGDDSAPSADVHVVSMSNFDVTIVASGELEAAKQTEIRSELENQAAIVYVIDEGVRVKKGERLIELNSDDIRSEIDEETLRVESARSDLIAAENALEIQKNENDADLRQVNLKIELADIELMKWREGDLVKKRKELDLAIEQADRNLELYKEQYEQTLDLYNRDFESKDKLKQDEIRYVEAQAEVERARLSKKVYEEYEYVQTQKQLTSDLEESRAERERVERQNASRLASKEADLTNRRRQLQIREDKLAKLQRQLAATKISAPTDGLVVYATSVGDNRMRSFSSGDGGLEIGRTVRPNELLIILPDTERMVASVKVHETNAGKIERSQRATVKIDAMPNKVFSGSVQSIGVLAESGGWRDPNLREYTVKILLDNTADTATLKPSMRCDSEIMIQHVNDVLSAPTQAVFREGRVAFVYTKESGRYARTPVMVGRRSSTTVEIAEGLKPGVQVLLREPSPGEVIDRPWSAEVLAKFAPPEPERPSPGMTPVADGERQGGNAERGGRQGMDPAAIAQWMKDNDGKKIDDLDLPEERKSMLRRFFPDGVVDASRMPGGGGSRGGGGNNGGAPGASSGAESAAQPAASPEE